MAAVWKMWKMKKWILMDLKEGEEKGTLAALDVATVLAVCCVVS